MTRINAKAIPINDNDYSCHITAVELFNQSYEVHIMPLVINSLGHGHTHTNTHTDDPQRINFKKGRRAPGLKTIKEIKWNLMVVIEQKLHNF